MGKVPKFLREIIARNIRECRVKKFPGRGGAKLCAEAFGVSPQQWSPWERGMRTPDELRLKQIAEFFGVTVEWMRKDRSPPQSMQPHGMAPADSEWEWRPPAGGGNFPGYGASPSGQVSGMNGAFPAWHSAPPGSPAGMYFLHKYFFDWIMSSGVTVRLDQQSIDAICDGLKKRM